MNPNLLTLAIGVAMVAKPLPDGKTAGLWRVSLTGPDGVVRKQDVPTLPALFDDCGPGGYSIVLSRLDTDGLQLDSMTTSYTIPDSSPAPTPATFDGIASITVSTMPNGSAAASGGDSTASPAPTATANAPAA